MKSVNVDDKGSIIVSLNDDNNYYMMKQWTLQNNKGGSEDYNNYNVVSCLCVVRSIKPQVSIRTWFSLHLFYMRRTQQIWPPPPQSYQSIIPSEQYLIRSTELIGTASSSSCQHSRIPFLEISDILFAANNLLPL